MGSFHNPADGIEDEELYEAFMNAHEARLRALTIPESKWRTLCRKLTSSIFDAGENFLYARAESSEEENDESGNNLRVFTRCAMSREDHEHIYLIDHAWTYVLTTARRMLENYSTLVERMAAIMEVSDSENIANDQQMKRILNKMWMFNNCFIYQQGNQASPISCWYVLDEFGSKIHFSEDPSFEIVPFFYVGDNTMYSLLYPKLEVAEGDEVTVVYPGYNNSLTEDMKKAILYPWINCDLSDYDFNLPEPSLDYFSSGRLEDILPDNEFDPEFKTSAEEQLAVFSDYSDVTEFLTHSSFRIVADKEQANILWLSEREYDIKKLIEIYPNFCFISQFPSEHVLINKDLLAMICRRCEESAFNFDTLESHPEWLPTTFNLKTELPKFVSYFQNRERRNMDNVWICKPFNLARGIDVNVSDNLSQIIRMSETRPMVACKYITDSVLFPSEGIGLVKMDLRYIVLLKSAEPLELYVYDRFWIRFANKPFVLEDFSDYERHFTVMNYVNFPLQQMYCHDFIQKFEDHYSSYKWCDIQEKINSMIKDIFVAASSKEPPAGLGKFRGSRAVYGLDVMLRWDRNHDVPVIKPMILEVNWMPDCKRACQYYPEFYNDVFSVLFLGDTKDKHVVKL